MFSSCKTKGIIIKRARWGEADLILTVFTEDLGKIQVLAKSVRKGKSKLAASLELLNLAQLELVRGYRFDLVTGAQCLNGFRLFKQDLSRLAWAHFFAEFLNNFSEEKAPDSRLYALFRNLFLNLNCSQKQEEWREAMASGQWRVLEYLGIEPRLLSCLWCGAVLSDKEELVFLGEGGVYCGRCGRTRKETFKADSQTLEILKQIRAVGVRAQDGGVQTKNNVNFALAYFLSASLAPRIKSLRFLPLAGNKNFCSLPKNA